MANFSISIGPLASAPLVVDSGKALAIVTNYLELQGVDASTNQEKIDALAVEIAKHIRARANEWARIKAAQQAEQNAPQDTWE